MSSPSLVWVTEDGNLAIGDMPNVGGYRGRRAPLQPKNTLSLALSESVLEVQTLNPQPSSPLPPPCPECAQTHIVPGAVHVCFWTMHPHPHPPPPPPGPSLHAQHNLPCCYLRVFWRCCPPPPLDLIPKHVSTVSSHKRLMAKAIQSELCNFSRFFCLSPSQTPLPYPLLFAPPPPPPPLGLHPWPPTTPAI